MDDLLQTSAVVVVLLAGLLIVRRLIEREEIRLEAEQERRRQSKVHGEPMTEQALLQALGERLSRAEAEFLAEVDRQPLRSSLGRGHSPAQFVAMLRGHETERR